MPGFSITLLLLPTEDEDDVPFTSDIVLSLLDDKPEVPGWKWSPGSAPLPQSQQVFSGNSVATITPSLEKIPVPKTAEFVENIKRVAHALINAEFEITEMDSIVGDGDCGLTLKVI
jgi:dihydroxyacetone kinase